MTKTDNNEKVLPEPGFIEQAYALIDKKYKDAEAIEDPRFGPGLRPWDHKLWVSIMDLQVQHVNEILVKEFAEKVAEHYKPIMECLEKIELRLDEHEKEIEKLKKTHKIPETFDTRLKEVESWGPVIEDLKSYASPKWTAVRWGIFSLITTLLLLVITERLPEIIHKIFGK
jgi:hypothetical protein